MSWLMKTALCVAIAVGLYFTKLYANGPMCESRARIDGKVVIVTGANTGIGKETVRDLVQRGGKVYMACRSSEKAHEAANGIKATTGIDDSHLPIIQLDLASLESIRNFVKEFKQKEKKLDILINSAGVIANPYTTTTDGFEITFGVNHLGHFLLTNLLMDLLIAGAPSRVVTVSSTGHRVSAGIQFDDVMFENQTNYHGFYAYTQSKLANILFTKELARRLDSTVVSAYSLCPGAVTTDIYHSIFHVLLEKFLLILATPFFKDPTHGAQTTVCCAIDDKLATDTGKYYKDCKEEEPSEAAQDAETARRLWDLSVELVKLKESEIHPQLR